MDDLLRTLAFAISLPWMADSVVRRVLAAAAGRWQPPPPEPSGSVSRFLVVVPARAEGRLVTATLESVNAAAADHQASALVLLDGADADSEEAARLQGASSVVKEPAGPTKGAALRWLVEQHPELLSGFDAVVVLDVGSLLERKFFDALDSSTISPVMQAWLRGAGDGVGETASLSERTAQEWQDRGRQVLGWSVQLRGTGMVMSPAALSALAPRLWTSIEDTEATLLLAADGERAVLTDPGCVVMDHKPSRVVDAARQRSRWLLGKLSLLAHRPRSIGQLLTRRPWEGIAFVCELVSRPLSVTAALRALLAAIFAVDGLAGTGGWWSLAAAGLLGLSLFSDVILFRRATGLPWHRLLNLAWRLGLSWIGAIIMLPRALFGWARARRR
jgi:hypothetical protein